MATAVSSGALSVSAETCQRREDVWEDEIYAFLIGGPLCETREGNLALLCYEVKLLRLWAKVLGVLS